MMEKMMAFSRGCTKGMLLALNVFCMYGEDQAFGTLTGDVLIALISVCLMAISILGCVGTVKENPKLLYLYVGLVLILMIMELMIGVFVAVQRRGLQIRVTDWLREDFFMNSTSDQFENHLKTWDNLQTDYECCGLNGPEDYKAFHMPISTSCCPLSYRARTTNAQKMLYAACIENMSYFNRGCEDEILETLQTDGECLMGVAIFCFWFEAAGMLSAMSLANTVKNSVQVYKQTVKY